MAQATSLRVLCPQVACLLRAVPGQQMPSASVERLVHVSAQPQSKQDEQPEQTHPYLNSSNRCRCSHSTAGLSGSGPTGSCAVCHCGCRTATSSRCRSASRMARLEESAPMTWDVAEEWQKLFLLDDSESLQVSLVSSRSLRPPAPRQAARCACLVVQSQVVRAADGQKPAPYWMTHMLAALMGARGCFEAFNTHLKASPVRMKRSGGVADPIALCSGVLLCAGILCTWPASQTSLGPPGAQGRAAARVAGGSLGRGTHSQSDEPSPPDASYDKATSGGSLRHNCGFVR